MASLLKPEVEDRMKMVLKYIEDMDLHRWSLPDINAFRIGLHEWRSKLNCITNPYIYKQVPCFNIQTLLSFLLFLLGYFLD